MKQRSVRGAYRPLFYPLFVTHRFTMSEIYGPIAEPADFSCAVQHFTFIMEQH